MDNIRRSAQADNRAMQHQTELNNQGQEEVVEATDDQVVMESRAELEEEGSVALPTQVEEEEVAESAGVNQSLDRDEKDVNEDIAV